MMATLSPSAMVRVNSPLPRGDPARRDTVDGPAGGAASARGPGHLGPAGRAARGVAWGHDHGAGAASHRQARAGGSWWLVGGPGPDRGRGRVAGDRLPRGHGPRA